jgi:hypothetical protein
VFCQALDHNDTSNVNAFRKYNVSPNTAVVNRKIRKVVYYILCQIEKRGTSLG